MSRPQPEMLAFLEDIKRYPDDNARRLIFADWLEEQGDPRGEFVRVQCLLAECASGDPRRKQLEKREQELLTRLRQRWLSAIFDDKGPQPARFDVTFRRGLLHFACPLDLFHQQSWSRWEVWRESEDLAWVEGLCLSGVRAESCRDLCSTPLFSTIGTLGLGLLPTGAALSIRSLANCAHLSCLASLELKNATLTDRDLSTLCRSEFLTQLQRLDLPGAGISARGVAFLAAFADLAYLDLHLNVFGDAGVTELAGLPLARLRSLNLDSDGITDRGAQSLSYSPYLRELRKLSLGGNLIGNDGALALAQSPIAENLRSLNLSNNRIGAKGADGVIYSAYLQSLKILQLDGNNIPEARQQRLRQRYKGASV